MKNCDGASQPDSFLIFHLKFKIRNFVRRQPDVRAHLKHFPLIELLFPLIDDLPDRSLVAGPVLRELDGENLRRPNGSFAQPRAAFTRVGQRLLAQTEPRCDCPFDLPKLLGLQLSEPTKQLDSRHRDDALRVEGAFFQKGNAKRAFKTRCPCCRGVWD